MNQIWWPPFGSSSPQPGAKPPTVSKATAASTFLPIAVIETLLGMYSTSRQAQYLRACPQVGRYQENP